MDGGSLVSGLYFAARAPLVVLRYSLSQLRGRGRDARRMIIIIIIIIVTSSPVRMIRMRG